ncbi:Acyl-CoA hydrolase [Nitrosomonas sp. Nm51]|uniref:acetyl-CoA hydrolase/transferase C-terminal domain-containing protein n=1 Tax=Nitrosomonas sp. Nm51 TaxID=133720 RepID=UPI0008D0ED62|nr:acetyl-CoA hydrolase/transferase C-terminal domain-containing protein [Nitrosomonas sp. Nm51]SER40107.1 Acyl-CoA hydrolase [Nitrosomonas sp. Nm51]
MTKKPVIHACPDTLASAIIEQTGKRIQLALPLGLGKANHIANALVRRALKDSTIHLQIFTALTLERPGLNSELKRRFFEPAFNRLFGDYPDLTYAKLLRTGNLPQNIVVNEFFLLAGQWLNVPKAQQHYIPVNYSHALACLLDNGVNVLAQLVAHDNGEYNLSCNPDITADLLKARREGRARFIFAAQRNRQLPFMYGDSQIVAQELDLLLESPDTDYELYSAPKRPVSLADQAIGLHAARLVRDGGTLQIGIGSVGDAVAHALILRHKHNAMFNKLVDELASQNAADHSDFYHDQPFKNGIYGMSEMFVDGFLRLAESGILTREVDGAVLHGAFFVECRDFYRRLRGMTEKERARFQMKAVSFTNEIYGDELNKRHARTKASFINNAMLATLLGAVIADALEDGTVVSGVGGQYNFVAQALALDDAFSIITLNATRQSKDETVSNITWSYGHTTIPWHLRDKVITEYGVAHLRGKSDAQAIAAMLAITDSRFQNGLLNKAKAAGKIDPDWTIPEAHRHNTPDRIKKVLQPAREAGVLPVFPFGTDFTETEQRLLPAMALLKQKSHSRRALLHLFINGLISGDLTAVEAACLTRMQLNKPANFKEYGYQKILTAALRKSKNW